MMLTEREQRERRLHDLECQIELVRSDLAMAARSGYPQATAQIQAHLSNLAIEHEELQKKLGGKQK